MERQYTVREIAEMFRRTPATVREWLRDGRMSGTHVNGQWLVSESAIQEFHDGRST